MKKEVKNELRNAISEKRISYKKRDRFPLAIPCPPIGDGSLLI